MNIDYKVHTGIKH